MDPPRFLCNGISPSDDDLVLYRFIILSTATSSRNISTTVQNFRSLEVGKVLAWIAVPQFLLVPLIATCCAGSIRG